MQCRKVLFFPLGSKRVSDMDARHLLHPMTTFGRNVATDAWSRVAIDSRVNDQKITISSVQSRVEDDQWGEVYCPSYHRVGQLDQLR